MIDMHSHILYDVDDGCKSIQDSIAIIRKMKKIGFDKIVLTPHYIKGSNYVCDNDTKKQRLNLINQLLKENEIDVELILGNEVYINDEIDDLIMSKQIFTINKTRYILIELPLYNKINNVEDIIYELKLRGYLPIIAHPERYLYFQQNKQELKKIYESGVYFQCNYGSVIGQYGKDAMNLVTYLLENNMVSFMGTDIHKPDSNVLSNFDQIKKKIIEYVGEDGFKRITCDNIIDVISDKDVEKFNVIRRKKGFFANFFKW